MSVSVPTGALMPALHPRERALSPRRAVTARERSFLRRSIAASVWFVHRADTEVDEDEVPTVTIERELLQALVEPMQGVDAPTKVMDRAALLELIDQTIDHTIEPQPAEVIDATPRAAKRKRGATTQSD
jgi:hypothetical protein